MDIFDIWVGNRNLTLLMLAVSVVIVLPVQLLLCFRVKSFRLRCMPAVILFLAVMANLVLYAATSSWKRLVFAAGAVYLVFMMLMCGLGWGVWVIVRRRRGGTL